MAKYVFKPISDSSIGTSRLTFEKISADISNPNNVSTNLESSIQVGDFVYALTKQAAVRTQGFPTAASSGEVDGEGNITTRNSDGDVITYTASGFSSTKQEGYSIADSEMAKVVGVSTDEFGVYVYIDIDKTLKTDVYGITGFYSQTPDEFLFERNINKINEAKIGFDRDAAQLVETDVIIKDVQSGQNLQDQSFNDLTTVDESFFAAALKSGNATSVVATNDTNQGASGGPIKVAEEFPEQSETSSSLLGVPRAETQLSLFSDVSTLGLEEKNWEVIPTANSRLRVQEWENRASERGGNRYIAKLIENIIEQALELSSNNAPYSFPWPNTNPRFHRASEFLKFKRWVILGNLLYLKFEGTSIADRFLNPSFVRMGTIQTPNLVTGGFRTTEIIQFGSGVEVEEGYRLIDIWTVTWQEMGNDTFSEYTKEAANSEILSSSTTPEIKTLIGDVSLGSDLGLIGSLDLAQFSGITNAEKRDNNYQLYYDVLVSLLSDFTFSNTQPGYLERNDIQQIVLQSKEVFRYQPGRISGFTFGSRTFIDPRITQNVAEWGVVNDTDEYIFQVSGPQLNIVRRSTVPLEDKAIELSTRGSINQVHVNSEEYLQNFPAVKDYTTGQTREPYYELKIPQYGWNIDSLDGNGPSGYSLDIRNVTMWKIEFSWYGAIGVVFYAYIPVENNEARWIKVHRIVIENTLARACLEDPYFRMRYLLRVSDRTQNIDPQYIYKYGSSVYIDGGDEGTKRPVSFTSRVVSVPEDQDVEKNASPQDNRFLPVLAIVPKKTLSNTDGIARKNRIISYPESLTVDATELIELDFIESTAANEYGFTYDDGLIWNRNASPAANPSTNVIDGSGAAAAGAFDSPLMQLGRRTRDDSPLAGRVIDMVWDFETINDSTIAYKMKLVTTDDNQTWRSLVLADHNCPSFDKDSPFISVRDHDAKLINPGLNGFYIDYNATLIDPNITKIAGSETSDPPTAIYDTFRLKRIGEGHYRDDLAYLENDTGNLGNVRKGLKLPVTEKYPAIISSSSTSVGTFRNRPEHRIPNSPYWSLNTYASGSSGYGQRNSSPTFQRDFVVRHVNTAELTPITKEFNDDGTLNTKFPFITIQLTPTRSLSFVDKSVCKVYTGGSIVPWSSLFGKIKVSRMEDAVCSSADELSGSEITCRFLNPHAQYAAAGQNKSWSTGNYIKTNWPEFSVGFTPYPPADTSTFGKNRNFDVNGTIRPLKEADHISADYTHQNNNIDINFGVESFHGETMWSFAGLMRDNFRIKAIPNEKYKSLTTGHDQGSPISDGSNTNFSMNIGGFPSYVKLSIDEKVVYTIYNDTGYTTFTALRSAIIADIAGNFNENVSFPDFPDATLGSVATPNDVGINGDNNDDYIIIDDADFATLVRQGVSIDGGEVIDGGTGASLSTATFFDSEPVRIQYYGGTTAEKQAAKTAGVFNRDGYLLKLTAHAGSLANGIQATFVKIEYPDGDNGTLVKVKRKLFGAAPTTFYPYIRLRHGGQLNSINYLQKTPNEEDQVVTSPEWVVFGAAKVHRPLKGSDTRAALSLRSSGGPKEGAENFNISERLSGIKADTSITKPFRSSVSEADFVVLSNDVTQNDTLPGGIRFNPDMRSKLAERAKKIASYYFGNNSPAIGYKRGRTSTISLNSIFGEDRTKILPDELGNKALMVRAQKVNLGDDTPTANVRISLNVNEI